MSRAHKEHGSRGKHKERLFQRAIKSTHTHTQEKKDPREKSSEEWSSTGKEGSTEKLRGIEKKSNRERERETGGPRAR